ncbi:MAG: hypothetical protein Q9217_005294 [Psora testacea]
MSESRLFMTSIDRFLFGHPSGYLFRSPNEFAPHAIWLTTAKEGYCTCIGCRKHSKNKRPMSSLSILPRIIHNRVPTSAVNSAAPQVRPRREDPLGPAKGCKGRTLTELLTELRTEKEMDVFIQESGNAVSRVLWEWDRLLLANNPDRLGKLIPKLSSVSS